MTPEVLRGRWPEFLNALRPRNLALEALMRSCEPVAVEGDVVLLGFVHGFHRSKVEEEANKQVVEDVLSGLIGQRYRVRCVLASQEHSTAPASRPPQASGSDKVPAPVDMDPLVRAAVEDLGAQVVQRPEAGA